MSRPQVQQFTYWSVTINNPDDNDRLIVRNPSEKYIRQCIWTNEVGADGTPHIQAWVRLWRNNGLSFMKKLYPRAHLKPLTKDDHNEHTHAYCQKDDATTSGAHVITMVDAKPDAVTILLKVFRATLDLYDVAVPTWANLHQRWVATKHGDFTATMAYAENCLVEKKPYLAPMIVSPAYRSVLLRFGKVLWDTMVDQECADRQTDTHAPTE